MSIPTGLVCIPSDEPTVHETPSSRVFRWVEAPGSVKLQRLLWTQASSGNGLSCHVGHLPHRSDLAVCSDESKQDGEDPQGLLKKGWRYWMCWLREEKALIVLNVCK